MSIGSAVLKLRQRYGHGVRTAYFRDVVRPQILNTSPLDDTTDSRCELHVLTSRSDWLNLIWSLKSFYAASERRYRLCIHEDGTLPSEALLHLRRLFPRARLIRRKDADARVFAELARYPHCLAFRQTNLLSPKIFDFASYLESDRMLLFDSDLLFFSEPTALLQRIENPAYLLNSYNSDCGNAYVVDPDEVQRSLGFRLEPRINSGLGLVHRQSMNREWIEEFLGLPGLVQGHFWRIEQQLFALCGSKFGVEMLPREYTVSLESNIPPAVFRHYVGEIRHLMYAEGVPLLVRRGILCDGVVPDRSDR